METNRKSTHVAYIVYLRRPLIWFKKVTNWNSNLKWWWKPINALKSSRSTMQDDIWNYFFQSFTVVNWRSCWDVCSKGSTVQVALLCLLRSCVHERVACFALLLSLFSFLSTEQVATELWEEVKKLWVYSFPAEWSSLGTDYTREALRYLEWLV